MRDSRHLIVALVLVLAAIPAAGAQTASRPLGFVDGSVFSELAGEDSEIVEISLPQSILKMMTGSGDADLDRLAAGLESMHAVIIGLEDVRKLERARDLVRSLEKDLLGRGWEKLASIREKGSEVKVLVLTRDDVIRGLVVMAADVEDGEIVFANLAGVLDLAAIAELGDKMDIPGLDQVGP